MVLVTYDVATETKEGSRRLRRVAKKCRNRGQRVQKSVFECILDPAQFAELKHDLVEIMNPEVDSIRFYLLGDNWRSRVEHVGARPSFDQEGPLIV
jgi:CRISPR-associated protein Cas2